MVLSFSVFYSKFSFVAAAVTLGNFFNEHIKQIVYIMSK